MSRRTLRRRPVKPKTRRAKRPPARLRAQRERMARDTVSLAEVLASVGGATLRTLLVDCPRMLVVADALVHAFGPDSSDGQAVDRIRANLTRVLEATRIEVRARLRREPSGSVR